MFANTILEYPLLTIVSTGKRSFESLGKIINRSGDTIKRRLRPAEESFCLIHRIAIEVFRDKEKLVVAIDDTLVKKFFSRLMRGAGLFYDTKLCRLIMAYRLLVIAVSDGRYTIPLRCTFLFAKELVERTIESKNELVKRLFLTAEKILPNKIIIFLADGAFASVELLGWAIQTKRSLQVRMHSNRVVEYKSKKIAIRDIKELRPKGRQMARTITVLWHGLKLYITAQRRIDKHGKETVVYQAATYKAKPSSHVKDYKKRWGIEKLFRTTKQHLGLQECFSTNMDTQLNHMAAVLLAYSIVQWNMQKRKYDTPEETIRALKKKKVDLLKYQFSRLGQIFGDVYA